MKYCLLTLTLFLGASTSCLGTTPEIRLPPFMGHSRKGSYDVEITRTEVFNGKKFKPVDGSFHIDVIDNSIRVITKRLTFNPSRPPKYQSEKIYSKRSGNLLTIDTEDGTKPSQVIYARHFQVDGEPAFYSGFHGVNVVNGVFSNTDGSLWDVIREHSEEIVAKKPILPEVVNIELLKRDSYWLLKEVRIHLARTQRERLYATKFYGFISPSTPPLSIMEKLDCEYGVDDRQQKYQYELSCKYEKDQSATVKMEITIQNYRSNVVVPPLSDDDEVYAPSIVAVPNGTKVDVFGENTIEYMWQDGRIVRRIDRKAIGAAKSVSFRRGSRSRLIWGVSSLVGLLLIIAVRIWSRRRTSS